MNKINKYKFYIFVLVIFLLIFSNIKANNVTISSSANWSTITGGSGFGGHISQYDNITLNASVTVTMDVAGDCNKISAMGDGSTIAGSSYTLTIHQSAGLWSPYTNCITTAAGTTNTISCKIAFKAARVIINNTGNLTISGAISGASSWLWKEGTGTLTLSSNSSDYTGVTWIDDGTVEITSLANVNGGASSLGAPTSVANGTIQMGYNGAVATLKYTGSGSSSNRVINIYTSATQTIDASGTGTLTLSGGITEQSNSGYNVILTGTGSGVESGIISLTNGGTVTKNGNGTWTLSGNNTYNSGTSDNAGTLIATSSSSALGTGTLTLNGGTLKLTNASGSNINFGNNITVSSSSQIITDVNASGAGNTYTLGTLDIGNNTLTISGGSNVNSGTAGITFSGKTSVSAASPTFTVNNPASGGTTQLSFAHVDDNNRTTTINGNGNVIQTDYWGNNNGGITYSGTGTLTLNQTNTFKGDVTVNSGMVIAKSDAQALGTGNAKLILNGGILKLTNASGSPLNFGRNTTVSASSQIITDVTVSSTAGNIYTLGTLDIGNNTLTITGGSNVNSGTAGLTFSGATNFNAASPTFTVNDPASGGATQLSFAIVNDNNYTATLNGSGDIIQTGVWGNTNGGIIYSGTGTLRLDQANTFKGGVTLNSGTLYINNAKALGASNGTFTIAGGTIDNTSGGAITNTSNNPLALNADFTFTGSNDLNLGTGNVTLSADRQITTSAKTLTIGGIISDYTKSITKLGNGTLSFGSNAVTIKSLTISAGTLTSTSGTMSLAGNFTNNSTFTHNSGTVTFNGSSAQSLGGTSSSTFYDLTINNSSGASNGVSLGIATSVSDVVTLTLGALKLNSYTLTVSSFAIGAIARNGTTQTGYIVSELNNATNTSILKWNCGATNGNYVFPFGTTDGTYIPVTFNKASGTANISISTRVTSNSCSSPSGTAGTCNQPWATGVTNMYVHGTYIDGSISSAIDRWWSIGSSASTSANVTFTYCGSENTTSGPTTTIAAQQWNGSGWNDGKGGAIGTYTSTGTLGVTSATGSVTATGLTEFSSAPYILVLGSSPLPIQLNKFSAVCNNNKIKLNWSTSSEINNDYFTIEKSRDAENWESVTTVKGAGNSNSILNYSVYDENPYIESIKGTSPTYYRLKQTDYDGQYEYFTPVNVMCDYEEENIFFNAYEDEYKNIIINYNTSEEDYYSVSVYNVMEKNVLGMDNRMSEKGFNQIKLNASNLSVGMYFIVLKKDDKYYTQKIILK
ncbi:MAG TPA: autotransporter-associated beta strand repeat-containing protein [Bacteroidales bacterium]|nr:autotransporter-associated beta strand repeat-containing protein [Bacteroidales bacterium]HPS16093.1 autotransporter-associated beta strand repeat-containing protein [Bacteroidales bacterium]